MPALANDQWSLAKFVHVRVRISTRRAAARIASRSWLPRSVDSTNGYIRGASRRSRDTIAWIARRSGRVRHKVPRAEVVPCVTAAARLLRTEGDELHRKRCWLPAHHGRQLEHHGNARRIVLRAGCHRHGVEMRADNYVGFVRVDPLVPRSH